MANLVVSANENSFDMYFANLQYADSAYQQFAYEVNGDIIDATVNGINWPGGTSFPPLSCGTSYLVRGAVKHNGTWYPVESGAYYSTLPCPSSRPSNWSWGFNVSQGQSCEVPASEWLSFLSHINAFRQYKNLGNYSFTTDGYIASGQPFYAWIANQAVAAISQMSPPTSPPVQVSSVSDFTAAWLNQLKNSLNSIP